MVRLLDSTLFPDSRESSGRDKSTSFYGFPYMDWEEAKSTGIKTSANVVLPSAEGTLHAAVRFIDNLGEPLAVGIIPVPPSV